MGIKKESKLQILSKINHLPTTTTLSTKALNSPEKSNPINPTKTTKAETEASLLQINYFIGTATTNTSHTKEISEEVIRQVKIFIPIIT